MINIEIRTAEERRTVQRLIDRTINSKGADEGRIRMLLAAATAWDAKVRRHRRSPLPAQPDVPASRGGLSRKLGNLLGTFRHGHRRDRDKLFDCGCCEIDIPARPV